MIPFSSPLASYRKYKEEIDRAISKVLKKGWYILGEQVSAFEKAFANFANMNNCIGVANGTEALTIALKSLNISYGDEVILPSHTAVATASAVEQAGASPVFADIEEKSYCIDPNKALSLITEKTKCIIAVHLYGQVANIDFLTKLCKDKGIYLIEDCAQAHGAGVNGKHVGSFSEAGCFSFYPTKNLGALGDGGALLTNNFQVAERCRLLRQYGWQERYISQISGINSRLDEIQAAVLNVKLKGLKKDTIKRREIALYYNKTLENLPLELPLFTEEGEGDYFENVFHLYVVRYKKRDDLLNYLRAKGVGASIHYPLPVHLQPAYKRYKKGDMEVTDRVIKEILTLPLYPELSDAEVEKIAKEVCNFFH